MAMLAGGQALGVNGNHRGSLASSVFIFCLTRFVTPIDITGFSLQSLTTFLWFHLCTQLTPTVWPATSLFLSVEYLPLLQFIHK